MSLDTLMILAVVLIVGICLGLIGKWQLEAEFRSPKFELDTLDKYRHMFDDDYYQRRRKEILRRMEAEG